MTGSRGERRRREDENEVLDAALALFVAQGYHGTSMQQIAERAEFSVGKIYTLFPSKDELLVSLQMREIDKLGPLIEGGMASDAPPLQILESMLSTAFAFASSSRDIIRFMETEHISHHRTTEQSIADLFRRHVRRLLDRSIAEGQLQEVDTELLATMIVGAGSALVHHLATTDAADPYADIPQRIMGLMVLPHLVPRKEGR